MPKRTSKEFDAFTNMVDRLLSVPRATIQARMDRYREEADKNPRKRGPKPKRKTSEPSASDRVEE